MKIQQHGIAGVATCLLLECGALGQTPDIAVFQGNGTLMWSNALSNQAYEVQWAPTLTGDWSTTWSSFDNISSTSQIVCATVPMFYRVCTAPHVGLLTEIFSGQFGCHAYVTTNTDSTYDGLEQEYYFGPVVSGPIAQDMNEHDNMSGDYLLVKQFTNLNAFVHRVENQLRRDGISGDAACCRVVYLYADGSTYEADECEYAPYYLPHTYANAHADKTVSSINVFLQGGNQHGYEQDDVVFGFVEKSSVMIELALPVLTGQVTHAQLNVEASRRDPGDHIAYELSDGMTTASNLLINTKTEIATLATNPTVLRVVLTPAKTNASPKSPAVKSLSLLYWFR